MLPHDKKQLQYIVSSCVCRVWPGYQCTLKIKAHHNSRKWLIIIFYSNTLAIQCQTNKTKTCIVVSTHKKDRFHYLQQPAGVTTSFYEYPFTSTNLLLIVIIYTPSHIIYADQVLLWVSKLCSVFFQNTLIRWLIHTLTATEKWKRKESQK